MFIFRRLGELIWSSRGRGSGREILNKWKLRGKKIWLENIGKNIRKKNLGLWEGWKKNLENYFGMQWVVHLVLGEVVVVLLLVLQQEEEGRQRKEKGRDRRS